MYICTWHSVFVQYNQYRHDSWMFSDAFCSTETGCERNSAKSATLAAAMWIDQQVDAVGSFQSLGC